MGGVILSESKYWLEDGKYKTEYNYFFKPTSGINTSTKIKAGTIVETYAMRHLRGKYANIIFMGTNGGYQSNKDLINQINAMIKYSRSNRYIVISQHVTNKVNNTIPKLMAMEDSLSLQYGKNYINLRSYLVERGLNDAGLKPTNEDLDSLSHGAVPPQLMEDGKHFTAKGYELIAKLVREKLQELGY